MARAAKLDLRAFQQELAARLAAKTTQQVEQSRLGLACAGAQWLIRLADAGEVIAVPAMATVPLTKPWYLGVANIRGNLYSVIDFAGFLGHAIEPAAAGSSQSARMVLFGPRVGELRAGLVVSRVLGLSNLAELESADPPAAAPAWYGACWTDRSGGGWQEIDLALLAQDPAFLQVGL
ncbi:MAG TPA: chemotaxis protein CheW [Candidatus Dormibacteraeota bacterium]|nr:chemotaxis protein CheW [Candidatus Dormibacteraeota bacterium]